MKKVFKIGLWVLLVAAIIIQFIPSSLETTKDFASTNIMNEGEGVSDEVSHLLKTQCMDCHSMNLVKPWYYRIRPLTFWIDHHVEEGREHLNFDYWTEESVKGKLKLLEECIEEVEEKEMPLKSYHYVHPSMTDEERKTLITFFKTKSTEVFP